MVRKILLFFISIFVCLAQFFFSFSSYLFARQEEVLLFIPSWEIVSEHLVHPGETYRLMGLWSAQYYYYPLAAALLNAFLISAVGTIIFLLIRRISQKKYNFLLALFPVFTLLKAHMQFQYFISGTYALLVMMLVLFIVLHFSDWRKRFVIGMAGTLFIYWFSGQLVLLYGVLLVAGEFIFFKRKAEIRSLISLGMAVILSVVGIRISLMMPLAYGFRGIKYHEIQLRPDSYIYYVWIVFSTLMLIVLIVSWLLKKAPEKTKAAKICIVAGILICLFFYSGYCLPGNYDIQRRMVDRLDYLARRHKWDDIIQMHFGKRIPGSVNRNYLNLALAQKGVLGNRLFYFDQNGPQGLLTSYNHTFDMSILLSDIHFAIGDVSLAEEYAMEALTLGRAGGSALAMQRLVQVSLVRKEWELAAKYLALLKEMPVYKDWAIRYEGYLRNPEQIAEVPELAGKCLPTEKNDNLLCLTDIDGLWNIHLNEPQPRRIAYEYLGCSYLLAKKNDKFKEFLLHTANLPVSKPIPLHFQEAALMIFANDTATLNSFHINKSVYKRFQNFSNQAGKEEPYPQGIRNLYSEYGNTYWFYYRYKNIER